MKHRRLRKTAAHLEITAFINLIVVLVPFLLSVAVFTRMSVIDLGLPAQSNSRVEQLKTDHLQLEVVLRPDALEVSDRIGGLIERIPDAAGVHDVRALRALVQQLKQKFPTQKDASVLSEPNTPYDALVQVMDALRSGRVAQDGKIVSAEMFPDLSVGDAPIVKTAAR
jgi:biopolymer transport protein ExbD